MDKNKEISVEEAWEKILEKYGIINQVGEKGIFHIETSQTKEFKEPRLMSRWDSSERLPSILEKNKVNILPNNRHSYVLGDFLLYQNIPGLEERVTKMTSVELPEYESIDVNNITSEANAINILILSEILDDFLETHENVGTFNGRMGTGISDFDVDMHREVKQSIVTNSAQCEIDGGFENLDSVVTTEAKNVMHPGFHVRQLYYPYRLWKTKVDKPAGLVFSIYSNKIYRLFKYEFTDINDYSSVKLIENKNYSLQDTEITLEELIEVSNETRVKYANNQDNRNLPPFVQTDSFERIVSLLENMYNNPMNDEEIAELMYFSLSFSNSKPAYRQSQYYYDTGKYLGLFERIKTEGNETKSVLTSLDKRIYKMQYKQRQLRLVSLVLEHQISSESFDLVAENFGELPEKGIIQKRMRELNVCNGSQIIRKSQSARCWLRWIFNLIKLS